MSELEFQLRTGARKTKVLGGTIMHLYWEPYCRDDGVMTTGFTVDINGRHFRFETLVEALVLFDTTEREIIIQEMANALLPPNDRVVIKRPPKF